MVVQVVRCISIQVNLQEVNCVSTTILRLLAVSIQLWFPTPQQTVAAIYTTQQQTSPVHSPVQIAPILKTAPPTTRPITVFLHLLPQ